MQKDEVGYLKAMTALTGRLVFVDGNQEAKMVLECMKEMQGFEYEAEKVVREALKYCEDGYIQYLIVNTVMDCIQISLIIATPNEPVPDNLDTEEGVFAYVYNKSYELDSELGYIFFERTEDGSYRRIG